MPSSGSAVTGAAEGGTVTLTYAGFRALDWKKHAAHVALHGSIPWEIAVMGGPSKPACELAALQLRSFEVTGGATDVAVSLPRPEGTVRIAFAGGASKLVLKRPGGVAISRPDVSSVE